MLRHKHRCLFDEQTESYNNGGCNGSEDAYSYKNEYDGVHNDAHGTAGNLSIYIFHTTKLVSWLQPEADP